MAGFFVTQLSLGCLIFSLASADPSLQSWYQMPQNSEAIPPQELEGRLFGVATNTALRTAYEARIKTLESTIGSLKNTSQTQSDTLKKLWDKLTAIEAEIKKLMEMEHMHEKPPKKPDYGDYEKPPMKPDYGDYEKPPKKPDYGDYEKPSTTTKKPYYYEKPEPEKPDYYEKPEPEKPDYYEKPVVVVVEKPGYPKPEYPPPSYPSPAPVPSYPKPVYPPPSYPSPAPVPSYPPMSGYNPPQPYPYPPQPAPAPAPAPYPMYPQPGPYYPPYGYPYPMPTMSPPNTTTTTTINPLINLPPSPWHLRLGKQLKGNKESNETLNVDQQKFKSSS